MHGTSLMHFEATLTMETFLNFQIIMPTKFCRNCVMHPVVVLAARECRCHIFRWPVLTLWTTSPKWRQQCSTKTLLCRNSGPGTRTHLTPTTSTTCTQTLLLWTSWEGWCFKLARLDFCYVGHIILLCNNVLSIFHPVQNCNTRSEIIASVGVQHDWLCLL